MEKIHKITFDLIGGNRLEQKITSDSYFDFDEYVKKLKCELSDEHKFLFLGGNNNKTILRKDRIERIIIEEEK